MFDNENVSAVSQLQESGACRLVLSKEGKKVYLDKVYNELIKILYLIEQEKTPGDAKSYIAGLLFELNNSDALFDHQLIKVVIKLNGVYSSYLDTPFNIIKKQIFEARGIIDHIRKSLE